jgi:hypothetical protein
VKPTAKELEIALQAVEAMREADDDPQFIAKSLLYLSQRDLLLEELLKHIRIYMEFGQFSEEHARLVVLLEKIREQDTIEEDLEEKEEKKIRD